jgi:enamine deaminase RidA (YjgF/YER057c/UK114 family)
MTETDIGTASPTERLQALGMDLPVVPPNPHFLHHRKVDSSIHVAGQLPYKDGVLLGKGILGRDVDLETGRELARHAVLNCLAVAGDAVGGLDNVRVVQMLVFVASTPEFELQSKVADAASDLLVDVLGENGRHARTAIGVASLPLHTPVEIQMICTTA